jgi:cell wall-associated NlpC family hydrolase
VNTKDPVSSLDGAARYDRDLIKRYGTVARALSAYNSGRPDAYQDPKFANGQTYNYVRSILGGAGGAASSGPSPAAAASPSLAGSLVAPPERPNPTAGLFQSLQTVQAPGPQRNDYSGFYGQLGAALKAKRQDALGAGPPAAAELAGDPQATTLAPGVTGIAKTALTQLGTPYQWGGKAALGSRTDCSGLLQASARANGINIGRTTYEQYKQGAPSR